VLFERLLGNDDVSIVVTEECPRKELVDNQPVGQTSCVLVSEEDLEAVRDELIKVGSYSSIYSFFFDPGLCIISLV
jgi:hypothetical protein